MSQDDFFIGWAEPPERDRRFFLRAGVALSAATLGSAGVLAALQSPTGTGNWDLSKEVELSGIVRASPYPMLRTRDLFGEPSTVLLGPQGKCGVAARISSVADTPVIVRGSLIQRDRHAMLAVSDGPDWMRAAPNLETRELQFETPTLLARLQLQGEILDSKCWFGAMRPAQGKVHKACASLCIRGGIPPAFYVRDRSDQQALMLMTSHGLAHGTNLLPFVGEPVAIVGQIKRASGLLWLDAPASTIRLL
ncbi:MAG: hypothetical protein AAF709_26130 [Pseudomonadota bacterium]